MDDKTSTQLTRKIALQRWAIAWEHIWAALHWPIVAAGLVVIVIASGLLQSLPDVARYVALGLCALAFLVSFRQLVKLAIPSKWAAMRRMETEVGLSHRSLSSKDDHIAAELASPEINELWIEHKRRELARLSGLAISPPRSSWREIDPRALRVAVALGAIVSLFLGSGNFQQSMGGASSLMAAEPVASLTLDAWLKPPAYTGKPPVLITSQAMKDKFARGESLSVPVNSVLSLRLTGAQEPKLDDAGNGIKTTATETGFTAEGKLTKSSILKIEDKSGQLANWKIDLIPDAVPKVAVSRPTEPEIGSNLTLNWSAEDDYGVSSVISEIDLADEQSDGLGFESNGPFLYDPPKFPVKLKKLNAKKQDGKSTQDLTAHPWAGLNVVIILNAKDAAGQTSEPQTLNLTLPERIFVRPLAKAIIEQRKQIIIDPEKAGEVAELFTAVLEYPEGLVERSGLLIRLAAITSRLKNMSEQDDIKQSVADLWQLAIDIDDGNLSDVKAELRELKKQLEQAMKNGASPEEIAKLMDKLRDAMDRYLEAMRQEQQRNPQANQSPRNGNSRQKQITQEDLQKMLDMIEKLQKDGQQDMAQQLLDELDKMLQNMQPGENQQAGEGDPMGEMMDQLSEMMREQQRLMDETQRMQNGQQPGQDGKDGNQQGQQGQNGQGQGSLSDRQGTLGDMLDRMMRELGGNAPGELGEAGREMRGAQGSLGEQDNESALRQQGNALDQMRKGAQALGRQMREGQGQARNRGRDGEAGGRDEDPLGRPRATRNPDEGPEKDMVPSELAIRRAREILEQLRSRANGETLGETERNYIDRLLRGLY